MTLFDPDTLEVPEAPAPAADPGGARPFTPDQAAAIAQRSPEAQGQRIAQETPDLQQGALSHTVGSHQSILLSTLQQKRHVF